MSQMALPLLLPADPQEDAFIVTPSNATAVQLLERWATWPVRVAILTGPRRSGRSLLARIFAAKSGGAIIDDAERLSEVQLFHAWNDAQAENRPLVIVADAVPPTWEVVLPDLRSRLGASPHAAIGAPDEELLRGLLDQMFERRRLDARDDLVDWLAARIQRSHLAVERTVDALEQQAMEQHRRLTIPLARNALVTTGLLAAGPHPAPSEDA